LIPGKKKNIGTAKNLYRGTKNALKDDKPEGPESETYLTQYWSVSMRWNMAAASRWLQFGIECTTKLSS